MLNRCVFIGRLTKEPDLRYTQSGTAVGKFTLAVDRRQSKDREKETDFIDIVVWSNTAEACANHLGKGHLVAVDGRLQIRSYEDSQGIRRKAAEVVAETVKFLSRPNSQGGSGTGQTDYGQEFGFNEDDIPF